MMKIRKFAPLLTLLTLTALIVFIVSLNDTTELDNPDLAVQEPNRIAYIDPVTGQLSSKPAPDSVTASQAARSDVQGAPPKVEYRPDGSIKIHLNERFNKSLMVTIDDEGNLSTAHGELESN